MPKISVVIITKNEEKNIKECLESVKWADEIILVDDFSKDNTVRIAQNYPQVKVFLHKFETFGRQRSFALNQARGEWILMLDADERITLKLKEEILNKIKKPDSYQAFNIYFQEYFWGKKLKLKKRGGHPRLFKKRMAYLEEVPIHEKIIVKGRVGRLENPIIHYSYQNLSHVLSKFNHYTTLEAKYLYSKGIRTNLIKIFLVPFYTFFRYWLNQRYIIDGKEGLMLSLLFAYYYFMKHLKLWALAKNKL
jgi:glycosyltransferase involved in cell wall biosynthesis